MKLLKIIYLISISAIFSLSAGTSHQIETNPLALQESYVIPPDSEVLWHSGKAHALEFVSEKPTRILVWNICKATHRDWDRDFQRLSKLTDMMLIQEAFLDKHLTSIIQTSKNFEWNLAISFIYLRNETRTPTGVATCGAIEATSVKFLRSHYREPFTGTPKMAIMSHYRISGSPQTFLAINVHALNFTLNHKFYRQMDQIEETLKTHSGPILFGGDFNTWNNNRMSYVLEMTKRHELHHVNFESTKVHRGLDHVFIRGLRVNIARVLEEIESSDHLPLYLEIFFTGSD